MKKLSDYKDEEAMELWADLIQPCVKIFGTESVQKTFKQGVPKLLMAQEIMKSCPDEACDIMRRIDPDTPIDGISVVARLLSLLKEVTENPAVQPFLASVAEAQKEQNSFGSAMENTEDNQDTSSDM